MSIGGSNVEGVQQTTTISHQMDIKEEGADVEHIGNVQPCPHRPRTVNNIKSQVKSIMRRGTAFFVGQSILRLWIALQPQLGSVH